MQDDSSSRFISIIEQAPLQTYCTVLAFIRLTNEILHHYWSQVQHWTKDIRMVEADAPNVKDEYKYVNDIAFTPDGRNIASVSTNEVVRCWDVSNRSSLGRFERQLDKVSSVTISPDGMMIASGSDDTMVMVWDLETRVIRYTLKGHSRWVNPVVFSPGGELLACQPQWTKQFGYAMRRQGRSSTYLTVTQVVSILSQYLQRIR